MSTSARFTGAANQENTARALQMDYQAPAFNATLALTIKRNAAKTLVGPIALTAAMSITANVGDAGDPPYVGDELELLFTNATGGALVVTLSTGFAGATLTLSVAATTGTGYIKAIFNCAAWQAVVLH